VKAVEMTFRITHQLELHVLELCQILLKAGVFQYHKFVNCIYWKCLRFRHWLSAIHGFSGLMN